MSVNRAVMKVVTTMMARFFDVQLPLGYPLTGVVEAGCRLHKIH